MSQEEGVNLEVTRILVLQVCIGPNKLPLYASVAPWVPWGRPEGDIQDHIHHSHECRPSSIPWVCPVLSCLCGSMKAFSSMCLTSHFGSVSDQLSHHQPSIPLGFGANLNQLWAVFGLGNQTRIAVKTDTVQSGRSLRQRSGKSFV